MAFKSVSVNLVLISAVLLNLILAMVIAKPVLENSEVIAVKADDVNSDREGRQFYGGGGYPGFGVGNSFSSASANANAGSSGFGFPGGFGNSQANAQASSISFGTGK